MRNLKPAAQRQLVQRHNITYDKTTVPTIYGGPAIACCPPFFDLSCTDGSIGIFHTGGEYEMAMRWFGIKRATAVREEINYLSFTGGIRRTAGDLSTPGTVESICSPGDQSVFGTTCTDVKTCFGLLKILSEPMVNGGSSIPYCIRDPRVLIDGQPVDSDQMWHEMNASETLLHTWMYNLMFGLRDANNPMGHYGLWSLLGGYGDARDYVYPCPQLKPTLLDWNGKDACSATAQTGITLNGQALSAQYTTNIYSTLRDIFRAKQRQISRTRGIASGTYGYGDWSIMMSPALAECLMACQTCYTECNNNQQWMDTERAALRLQELRTGGEGFGELIFDQYTVPIIPFDPTLISTTGAVTTELSGMVNPDGTYNAMLLYRGSGNQRVLQPEYNPLDDGTWPTRDNGLVQVYKDVSDVCETLGLRSEWRWEKRGIFFSTLIKNIKCDTILPTNLVTSFTAATANCP